MKKQICSAFMVILLVMSLTGCDYNRSERRVIREFEKNKDAFVTVATYIESFDWDRTIAKSEAATYSSRFGFTKVGGLEFDSYDRIAEQEAAIPPVDDETARSVRTILKRLDYWTASRSTTSGSTIVFQQDGGYDWPLEPYVRNGVAYVIDGGEPTPKLQSEMTIDRIVSLGDDWYYWHGRVYPG